MKNNFNIKNGSVSAPYPSGRAGVGLKICGMKYPENIQEVSKLLPDYLGFIFYEKSTRYFNQEIPEIPISIKKVGVFVNEIEENIISKIKKYKLDLVQLHGNESPELCKNLQKQNVEVIKVFSVDDNFNFEELEQYEAACDYFLFDTKGKLHGGNGFTFNWDILKKYKSQKPIFLSGGIGLQEIEQLKQLHLPVFALDVNSKFETQPGLKNANLLKSFINEIKLLNS